MCRARVPAPVPRIILWRSRLETISSTTGQTAPRPRSMMLWPPIFTTFTQGRIARLGVASLARCSVASLSDPLTRQALPEFGQHGVLYGVRHSVRHPWLEAVNHQVEPEGFDRHGIEGAE